jgi:hypothetical protein
MSVRQVRWLDGGYAQGCRADCRLEEAVVQLGGWIHRAHAFGPARGHAFVAGQKEGIDRDAPLIMAEAR